ncbi:MAG: hypothetical protein P0116_11255 [Candidatus Nitrosocosmicus sp.]|nr:hypothetical protein [Candidatus Nitrosocosmicus sp.]
MQKLLILSVLLIGAFVGTSFGWTQLGSVQATLNQSGPIQSGNVQCFAAPCNYPPSQTTTTLNQSGPIQSGNVQCFAAPCNYQSPPPLSLSPNLDGNDNTITAPKSEIETPHESQNSSDKNEPCLSPCPPGTEMCIQMCKPTSQQGTVNKDPQSDSQQESNFSPQTDEDLSDTTTTEESTTNNEVDSSDLEPSDSDSETPLN